MFGDEAMKADSETRIKPCAMNVENWFCRKVEQKRVATIVSCNNSIVQACNNRVEKWNFNREQEKQKKYENIAVFKFRSVLHNNIMEKWENDLIEKKIHNTLDRSDDGKTLKGGKSEKLKKSF